VGDGKAGRGVGWRGIPRTICWVVAWGAVLVGATAGCRRCDYRLAADADAYALIESKQCPHWPLEDYQIDVDPASRMYDPDSPDCPPMPPDDPTSHQYMHCVYCMEGYPCWHANGDTPYVENPNYLNYLPRLPDGRVFLDADGAVRTALLHSPTYQQQLEELYLSALDVSFERFRFDTQFFGGGSLYYTADGRDRAGGESSSELTLGTPATIPGGRNWQARKLFSTGSELVVGVANSLMWQFSGPDSQTATTLLDFSLIQPLLRAGGRDLVLERLTIAERALLANVRQMERYRRGFYVQVMTGVDAGPGPSRRGGFFGGSGLEGFSGVGGGGFGRVGGTGGGTGGANAAGGAGAGQAGGYLGLLQVQLQIRNQRANLAALQSSVVQLESFYLAGRIDYFQVELARQAFFETQSRLLNAEAAFQFDLDRFKRTLGLPPDLELALDDTPVQPFQLVDPAIVPLQNRLTDVQQRVGRSILTALEDEEANQGEADVEQQLAALEREIQEARGVLKELLDEHVPRVRRDLVQLRESIPARSREIRRLNQQYMERIRVQESTDDSAESLSSDEEMELLPFQPEELAELPTRLNTTLDSLVQRYEEHDRRLEELATRFAEVQQRLQEDPTKVSNEELQTELFSPVPNALNEISADALSLTLVQARARTHSAALVPSELEWQSAVEIARTNRRDWMNARAALVDSWRLIQFNSDALQSQLDIVFAGDIGNTNGEFFDLSDTTGRLRVGLQFDAPLTRLSERNTYRQSLIEYQQARRQYYRLVDGISLQLRNTVRSMDVNQLNFELRRAAVEVAIAQVELARLRLQEPPRPAEQAELGATTARDLVSALSDLLSAQNDFLSVWISHEVLRRSLDFDMGTMQLDPSGIWLDPGPLVGDPAANLPAPDQPLPESEIIQPISFEEEIHDLHRLPTPH
jgi:outer membrane protein TolC